MFLAQPVKQQGRTQPLRQLLWRLFQPDLRTRFRVGGQPFCKCPGPTKLCLIHCLRGSTTANQKINVFPIDGNPAGKKTQSQLIVVDRPSRLLNRVDRLEVLAFGINKSSLIVQHLSQTSLSFPAQRHLQSGIGKDPIEELSRFAEMLPSGCNVASQDARSRGTELVEAFFLHLQSLSIVSLCLRKLTFPEQYFRQSI